MDSPRSDFDYSEIAALKAENAQLRARNNDLYKDCVAFAKLIKQNGKDEERREQKIVALQNENAALKLQIEKLKNPNSNSDEDFKEYGEGSEIVPGNIIPSNDSIAYNPKVQFIAEENFDEAQFDFHEEKKTKKRKSTKKKVQSFFKSFAGLLFAISLIISILSGVFYLFSTTYKDYSVINYRLATVTNNNLSPTVNKNDVVLIKYNGFDGIKLDSLVVTKKDSRSVARITALSVSGDTTVATVEDKKETYDVSTDEFVGQVELVIPYVGILVQFASANPYSYIALLACANILFVSLLILIPSNKKKKVKGPKKVNPEEFTI